MRRDALSAQRRCADADCEMHAERPNQEPLDRAHALPELLRATQILPRRRTAARPREHQSRGCRTPVRGGPASMASARAGLPLLLAHDDARGSVVEPSGRAFVLRLDSSQPVRVHLGARLMDALHGHDGGGSEDGADAGDRVQGAIASEGEDAPVAGAWRTRAPDVVVRCRPPPSATPWSDAAAADESSGEALHGPHGA